MAEYPNREIEIDGRSVLCQILNWRDGPPPRYLVCHPAGDRTLREQFLAEYRMGAWMKADLAKAINDLDVEAGVEKPATVHPGRGLGIS